MRILITIFSLFFTTAAAWADPCPPEKSSFNSDFLASEHVVIATAMEDLTSKSSSMEEVVEFFKVVNVYKGNLYPDETFIAASSYWTPDFKEGEEYLIFMDREHDRFVIPLCRYSGLVEDVLKTAGFASKAELTEALVRNQSTTESVE